MVVLAAPVSRRDLSDADLRSSEKALEDCLQPEIRDAVPQIGFMPAAQFRTLPVVQSLDMDWASRPKELVRRLKESGAAQALSGSGVRYLVILSLRDSTTSNRPRVEVVGGEAPGIGVVSNQKTSVLVQANVLDLKHERIAGWLESYASGERAAGVGLAFFIVPIPVFYSTPFMESSVCEAMGEALGAFLAN